MADQQINPQGGGAFPQKLKDMLDGTWAQVFAQRQAERLDPTYSTAMNVTAAASATDIATLNGSATKTVRVTRVIITGQQTTAGMVDLQLIKRSAANTGGTAVASTAIPHDSTDAAATASAQKWTANPGALGTTVGNIRRAYLGAEAPAGTTIDRLVWDFGDTGEAVTLRGIAETLAVNLNGVTVTGGIFDIAFEWREQ